MTGSSDALNAWLERLDDASEAHLRSAAVSAADEVTTRFEAPLAAITGAMSPSSWRHTVDSEGIVHLHGELSAAQLNALKAALLQLKPWRKGPVVFHGQTSSFTIDAEWQSHWKWQRLQDHLPELCDRVVVDVGANNGFYSYHLAELSPRALISVDPTALYAAQCSALYQASSPQRAAFTPLGLEVLAHTPASVDVLLLMGILYHHSDPVGVLRLCRDALAPGGDLVIETIVIAGDEPHALFPSRRYTGARGFYFLPTMSCLQAWIRRSGLQIQSVSEPSYTTAEEQRSTAWREGSSLAEGLDSDDPKRTVEGYPAPQRVILRCTR